MRTCLCWPVLAWGTLLLATCNVPAAELSLPAREAVLGGLRAAHPRLLATADDFGRLEVACRENPLARAWLAQLRGEAEQLLKAPPVEYEIPDGKRLLAVSRRAKDRVLLLGLMYRLTREPRYAERLWQELDTVSRFKDWNPSHFLDTAEMTFAVAIGYDWLHDTWSPEQRRHLRQAMLELGLKPGLAVYRRQTWWARAVHNWNQVCNGGMAIGALALADDEPELAAEVLHAALVALPLAMHEFRPDGAWGEGPGYWRYATEYNVYFLAALRSALGSDFGLAQAPGFAETGFFPIHFVGATGMTFNFADAHEGWHGASQLFWLATAFKQPAFAAAQLPHATAHPEPLDLLWGADWLQGKAPTIEQPLAKVFRGVQVVTLRSAWHDPRAAFVGFKGGDNRVNHGHLDLGSFVLEADGVRWALDLGSDDYNIPGYFGAQRWTYYRNMTAGHNTLLIGGENQATSARAGIVRFGATDQYSAAIADLSAAYPAAHKVERGIALLPNRRVMVQDEIAAEKESPVAWNLHTRAKVSLAGSAATLAWEGRQLRAEILAPPGAEFSVHEVSTEPPQRPLENVRRLTIALDTPPADLRLVVLFSPEGAEGPAPKITPLAHWPGKAPE